jgi:hypothetical protein
VLNKSCGSDRTAVKKLKKLIKKGLTSRCPMAVH